ncbi:hypothetical protein GLOTRDRAFT_127566 [Gloeophyllum trabeum ATCC 11539]|uniref:Uncharacterized protein n=1 Tax=Gloeophyllum trabeum (strain ATCC 11539 / FP-39264 / Madison 617) TaxID=670483 RepID=S7QB80_GLOTA|nr:uncharacterized protein GLOTRDRAFT_127566 [Gloeophyllum trabeum ATCC 11539]EPQ57196.1 hypothetical protein GLOTRDRAFT_127566 [Gloeophyllum trabeum ATCC 11539]
MAPAGPTSSPFSFGSEDTASSSSWWGKIWKAKELPGASETISVKLTYVPRSGPMDEYIRATYTCSGMEKLVCRRTVSPTRSGSSCSDRSIRENEGIRAPRNSTDINHDPFLRAMRYEK